MYKRIDLANLDNLKARDSALAKTSWPTNLLPTNVSYSSHGHLLIIGSESACRRAAFALREHPFPSLSLLVTHSNGAASTLDLEIRTATQPLPCHYAKGVSIEGYLGQFKVHVALEEDAIDLATATIARPHFDMILDLGEIPCLALELPPPGYFITRLDSHDWSRVLDALPEHIGEFEKPKYFNIDHSICAHAGRGKAGCTRCLEICPADAIVSHQKRIEAWIEIDPFLCHGAGSCTSACPTGAIQYRLPEPQRQQDYVRRLLGAYLEAGGQQPVIRFVEQTYLEREVTLPAAHVLDVPLEELGAAGLDHWLGALADGACEVRIQMSNSLPVSLVSLIDDQMAQTHSLLEALGHHSQRVLRLLEADDASRDAAPNLVAIGRREELPSATAKRAALNETLAWLAESGTPQAARHDMPAGAAFGAIEVDNNLCTLCMSCVAVCPTPALAAGKDQPQLSFREADCVQCGLCDNACPENAISLQPGFLAAPDLRETRRICKEEAAFECISCGKPFATVSTIANIKSKLAAHPYFAGDALQRLEMCEDCRVKDVWRDLAKDPSAQLNV